MSTRKQKPRPRGGQHRRKTVPGPIVEPTVRTARNTRQNITTGTVADVARFIPAQPDTSEITVPVPSTVSTRFADDFVQDCITFIKKTGTDEFIDTRYRASKKKKGRPADIPSSLPILVAMLLAVRDSRPLLVTEIRDILHLRLSPAMQRMLNIKAEPRPDEPAAGRKWEKSTYANARRAFHRLLKPIDPSTLPKNRVRTWEELEPLKRDLTDAKQHELLGALDWVSNQILETAYLQLPEQVRERHEQSQTGYGIDGTFIPVFARGKGIDNEYASTDPDGGFYVREGDHRDPQDAPHPHDPFRRTTTKVEWGMEANLATITDSTHPDRLYMPSIPIAFSLARPGVDPAGAARRVFASLTTRGHKPGWLAGDILYTNQDSTKFQTPARDAGFDLVLGYGSTQIGVQGAHHTGMVLVEGAYYAPCMPDDLREATKAFREKRITHTEFTTLIKARVEYKMRNKEKAKGNVKERLNCPAAGPNPTAICALKPKSETPRPIRQADGHVADLRRRINHKPVLTDGQAPKVCQQETVTLTPEDGAKFRQSLQFGTSEHAEVYNRLRQSQEGVHGTAKDEAGVALANSGRRRIRGWAATQLFTAFLFAETASRRIRTWLNNHQLDEHGHMYVPRKPRVGDHGPTHSPPGGVPILEDPPPIAA